MFDYSVIIPHKNAFDLLKRCVSSIPDFDNIQIINIFVGIKQTEH